MTVTSILAFALLSWTRGLARGETLPGEGRDPASGYVDALASEPESFSPVVADDVVAPNRVGMPSSITDSRLLRREPLTRQIVPPLSDSSSDAAPSSLQLQHEGLSGVPDAGSAALVESTANEHQGPNGPAQSDYKAFTSAKGFAAGTVVGQAFSTTNGPDGPSNTKEVTPIQRHLVQYTTPGPVVAWTTAPWGWDENWQPSSTLNMSRWARYTTGPPSDAFEASTSGFEREFPWDVSTTEGSARPPSIATFSGDDSWPEAPDSDEHRQPVSDQSEPGGYDPEKQRFTSENLR